MKINTTKQAEAIRPKHIVVGIHYQSDERTILTKTDFDNGHYMFLALDDDFTKGNCYEYNYLERYSMAEIIISHKLNGFRCHTFKKMDEALNFLINPETSC